ncbi:MAG: hypothetical protein K2X74_00640 [Acetobacteraceae bacterium]|nr:hypothetical protein [Acetobacteraceae bacterium]
MTVMERLHNLAEHIERHAATGLPLLAPDMQAIAAALHAAADEITDRHRRPALRLVPAQRSAA